VWSQGKGTEFGRKAIPQAPSQGIGHMLKNSMYFTPIRCQQPLFWSTTKHLCFLSEKNPAFPRASGLCADTSAS